MFDVTADGGDTINVGARVFEGDFPLDLWAWMDDSQTDIQDGYIEDNDMLFRILDKSEVDARTEQIQNEGSCGRSRLGSRPVATRGPLHAGRGDDAQPGCSRRPMD